MLIIFIAIILPFWIKARKYKILSFSLSIYLVYIITTGGDFMGGRFYSVPFLLSVLLIIDVLMNKKNFFEIKYLIFRSVSFTNAWLLVISVIIYNIISPVTPVKYFFLRSIKNLNENSQTVKSIPSIFDIKNQYNRTFINGDKSYYFWDSNLLFYSRKGYPIFPSHAQRDKSTCDSCRNDKNMVLIKGGGIYGFCFGPTKFLIDAQSLSDPLIARLPPPDLSDGFFVAHFTKGIPAGYPESCSANKNLIEDQKLREYYEKIRTITRGDIFSLKRFQYIFELNFTHQRKYMEIYKSITTGEANPKIDL
jgi:arabinofuranosyltransferase